MWKTFAAVLLLTSLYALPASARDGAGAETVPEVGYPDLPYIPAQPARPPQLRHLRWHRDCVCYR